MKGAEERVRETIYPKFASSRLATGYTLIRPHGNLSTPTLLSTSLPPPSPPFRSSPATSIHPFFCPRNEGGIQHWPPSLAMKKSAKPRSLTGILNTDDSSVIFLQLPSFFAIPRSSLLDSFAVAILFRSFFLLFNPLPIGIEARQRASCRCGYLAQCGYS